MKKKLKEAANTGNNWPDCLQEDVPQAANRHQMIALAAYFRAAQRGFVGGGELDDWLAAEAELDAMPSR